MLKKIIILLFITNITINNINASINNKTIFFIAKKQFLENQYEKSIYSFNQLIKKEKPYSKISKKSKIYTIIAQYKLNKIKNSLNNIKNYIDNNDKDKYLDYVNYIESIIVEKSNDNKIYDIIPINKFKRDQEFAKEIIKKLKNIKKNKNFKLNKKISKQINKIQENIINHEIYIANFYIKKKIYNQVENRTKRFIKTKNLKNALNYNLMYKTIKLYNEKYDKIKSRKIIKFKKNERKEKKLKKKMHGIPNISK